MKNRLSKKTLVSVIIPTYNRAGIIRRTIESVLAQTYQNLEIIIVDDASKDNTEEVVKAIEDERIRYVPNAKNHGASITRNNGVEAAKGEYVAFLDSDDVWLPDKIELQLPLLYNHPHPEKVVGYTQVTNDEGVSISVMPDRGKKQEEPVADYLFVKRGLIQTGTLMMPRNLALTMPFKPGIVPYEDMDLCLRLDAAGAFFVFEEKPLTVWHNEKRSDRVTNTNDYLLPLNWIREYEGSISPRAMKGFLVHWIVPLLSESEQKRLYAIKLILGAALHGVISAKQCSLLLVRATIPKRIRQNVKGFVQKRLGHLSTPSLPEV